MSKNQSTYIEFIYKEYFQRKIVNLLNSPSQHLTQYQERKPDFHDQRRSIRGNELAKHTVEVATDETNDSTARILLQP